MAELRVKGTGTLKLFENDNTSSVTIASPASLGADRTVTLPDGDVTLATGTMPVLTGSTNNQVTTVTAANAIQGETNFIYDGTIVGAGADGANAGLGSGLHIKTSDTTGSVSANSDNLVLEENGNVGLTMLSATNGTGHIFFGNGGDEDEGFITYDSDNNRMRFGANTAERMRLGGTGTVSIPDSTDAGRIDIAGGSDDPYIVWRGPGTGTNTKAMFVVNSVEVGTINTTSSATAYNTSSDYRLKENETSITDGIDRIKQLKPYRFNFKVDADKTVDGFFAHEVSGIVPEAISGEKDAMHPEVLYVEGDELPEGKEIGDVKEETKIDPQGIDQAKLVPLLTSALQEAITKIETLEAKVTALENA